MHAAVRQLTLSLSCMCRHVMQTHLNVSLDEEWVMTGLREPASFFLMSVCIRCAIWHLSSLESWTYCLCSEAHIYSLQQPYLAVCDAICRLFLTSQLHWCRSAEGRRRIITEIVETLSFHEPVPGRPAESEAAYSAAELANAPFMSKKGWATPCKVLCNKLKARSPACLSPMPCGAITKQHQLA